MAAVADENDPNNESNAVDNDISNNKHSSSKHNDDDKNIHVPKDKKLKIDYVSVKEASIQNDVCFYDIHVRTSQHSWHVTKRSVRILPFHFMGCIFTAFWSIAFSRKRCEFGIMQYDRMSLVLCILQILRSRGPAPSAAAALEWQIAFTSG